MACLGCEYKSGRVLPVTPVSYTHLDVYKRQGYTYLKKLFLSIRHAQKDFNWLITDCQCCTQSEAFYQRIFQYDRYGWLSGEELTRMAVSYTHLDVYKRQVCMLYTAKTGFGTNKKTGRHVRSDTEYGKDFLI